MSFGLLIGAAAFIWIFIKLPQEWWIHVARLDMTDFLKEEVFGVPAESRRRSRRWLRTPRWCWWLGSWRCSPPWWWLPRRLPPADRPFTLDADAQQPAVDPVEFAGDATAWQKASSIAKLVEKIVLVALMSVIFAQMLPGEEESPLGVAIGVGLVILVNTAVSE